MNARRARPAREQCALTSTLVRRSDTGVDLVSTAKVAQAICAPRWTYVSAARASGDGEYRFRPYIQFYELGASRFLPAARNMQHAVGEEHFFLCRGAV
jgi:hypothetical protein